MSEDTLEVRCVWYHASREQRRSEIRSGHGLKGTMAYELVGCYDCLGTRKEGKKCGEYIDLKGLNQELK